MRLLAKDPSERPDSAQDVINALDAIDLTARGETVEQDQTSLESLAGGVFVGREELRLVGTGRRLRGPGIRVAVATGKDPAIKSGELTRRCCKGQDAQNLPPIHALATHASPPTGSIEPNCQTARKPMS